jgi:hypothetical protein
LKYASSFAESKGSNSLASSVDSFGTTVGAIGASYEASFSDKPELGGAAIAAGIVAAAATGLVLSAAIPEIAAGYAAAISSGLVGMGVESGAVAAALADTLSPYMAARLANFLTMRPLLAQVQQSTY